MREKNELYSESMNKWGVQSQFAMLAEECCELAIEALKQHRIVNGSNLIDLCSEIADVEIMIEQMRHCFDLGNIIDVEKERKLKRLDELLEDK